jgi:hypothetical protein
MYACVRGGSAKGDFLSSIGEYTVVASANRGVRGTLSEDVDEESADDVLGVRSRVRGVGRLFSDGAT